MKLKKMKKSLIFGFVALFLIVNGVLISAITGSIGNARMVLYPEVDGKTDTIIEKTILVKNVNDIPINITLVADEGAKEFIEVIDKTFILEAKDEKKAQFEVRVKKEGTYEGRINVFFTPIEGNEPGVVLASSITVIAKKEKNYEELEEEEDLNLDEIEDEFSDTQSLEKNSSESKNGTAFLIISTCVLLLVLIFLFYLGGKKRKPSKSKKRKNK